MQGGVHQGQRSGRQTLMTGQSALVFRNKPNSLEKVQGCRKTSIDTFSKANISPMTYKNAMGLSPV